MLNKFETRHFLEGQKIGDKIIKSLQKDDPRSAMIALAMSCVIAMKACGAKVPHVTQLLNMINDELEKSPIAVAAQDAISSLILPGRMH